MITEENLDAKVDEILNSDIIDYNFCVGYNGNITKGTGSKADFNKNANPNENSEDSLLSITV